MGKQAEATDGGYGWVIVGAAFVLNAMMTFTFSPFGVYYIAFVEHFHQLGHLVVWAHSAQALFAGLFAKLSAVLVRRIGYRKLSMIGGLFYTSGCLITSLAPHVSFVIIGYGVMLGLGNSCTFMSSVVAVQDYFHKRRGFATGLSFFGISAAMFVASPLIQLLIGHYGWRGSLLIHSAIMLHCVPAAMLMKPFVAPGLSIALEEPANAKELEKLNKLPHYDTDSVHSSWSADISKQLNHMKVETQSEIMEKNNNVENKEKRTSILGAVFDFSLLLNPHFVLFSLVNITFQLGLNVPLVFQISRAVSLGTAHKSAALLGSAYGLGNAISRVPIGYLADKVDRRIMYGALNLFCGVLTVIVSFSYSFPIMLTYAALLGFLAGGFILITAPTAVDLVGIEKIHKGQGLSMMFTGLASMCSAPFAGILFRITHSYDLAFLIVGALMTLGGAVMASLYTAIRIRNSCKYQVVSGTDI